MDSLLLVMRCPPVSVDPVTLLKGSFLKKAKELAHTWANIEVCITSIRLDSDDIYS